MTLIVDLPDSLEHELESAAKQRGLPLADYVLQLLARWQVLETANHPESEQDPIDRVLAASGRVLLPQTKAVPTSAPRQTPVPVTGKPVSEIAIEQRG